MNKKIIFLLILMLVLLSGCCKKNYVKLNDAESMGIKYDEKDIIQLE